MSRCCPLMRVSHKEVGGAFGGAGDPSVKRPMTAVYINPPLWAPPDPIDCPPFAFLGSLHGAAALQEQGVRVRLLESFVLTEPLLEGGWVRLGPEPAALVSEVGDEPNLVVVHFSPFARLERNLSQVLAPLLAGLARPGRTLVLADGSLGETHHVATDPAWLFERFPELDAWASREPERPLEALVAGCSHPRLFLRSGAAGVSRGAGPNTQRSRWPSPLGSCDIPATVAWLGSAALEPWMPGRGQLRLFPYVASRGCPHRCSFCTSETGRRYAGLPLDRVRADLTLLRDEGVQQVWLLDAIANANRQRFLGLLEIFEDLGLRIALPNGLRIDRLDPPMLGRLARLADRVPMSLESADEEVLASLGKGLSVARARKTLEAAAEAGLPTAVHYIIGAPQETAAQVNRTLSFAFEARRRWGAEPLVQPHVPPSLLAVPTGGGGGLGGDFYGAFGRSPVATPGAIEPGLLRRFLDSVDRRLAAPGQAKLILNLSYRCNNECVFCSVGDRERVDGRLEDQLAALEGAAARGVRLLDVDGGEPTLYPSLFRVLDRARELGFERITVTTNGRMLGYEGLAARLAQREVELLVSLHGASAAVHDAITRADGSFEQTLAGIRLARRHFERLGVNTTVVAGNLSQLSELGRLLLSMGVDTWNVQLVTPFGHAIGRGELAPDPRETVGILKELRKRLPGRLELRVVGMAPCELGEDEALGLDDHHKVVRQMLFVDGAQVSLGDYLDERRSHDAACDRCARRLLCGGRWDFETDFEDRHRGGPSPRRPAGSEPGAAAGPAEGLKVRPGARLLDIIAGYSCNLVCDYCSVTEQMRKVQMSTSQVLSYLRQGRAQDIGCVNFGGGEPTIRPDIVKLTRAARRLGYATIRYQTNGLLFAYGDFARRAVEAGLNRLHLSLMTSRADRYDRITGLGGSLEMVLQGLTNLRPLPVTLVADLILKADTYRDVHRTVEFFLGKGITEVNLLLVSLTGRNAQHPRSLVRVSTMRPHILRALELGREHGVVVKVRSIPACMLPGYEDHVVRLGEEDVWIVTPRSAFWLLDSEVSANRLAPGCAGCAIQGACWGLQPDYLARFGDGEVRPFRRPPEPLRDGPARQEAGG